MGFPRRGFLQVPIRIEFCELARAQLVATVEVVLIGGVPFKDHQGLVVQYEVRSFVVGRKHLERGFEFQRPLPGDAIPDA